MLKLAEQKILNLGGDPKREIWRLGLTSDVVQFSWHCLRESGGFHEDMI